MFARRVAQGIWLDTACKAAAAQAELQASINRAGLRNDPFRHTLEALLEVMGLVPDLAQKLKAALARFEQAVVTGTDRHAATLARAHNWRTLLVAVMVLVGTVAVAGICGYWAGWHAQAVVVISVETGLTAAFRDGPDAAGM